MSLPVLPPDGMHDGPSSSSLPCHDVHRHRETCRPAGPPDRRPLPLATVGVGSSPAVVEEFRKPEAAVGMCYIPGPAGDSVSHSTAGPGLGEAVHCLRQLVGIVEGRPQARTEEELAGICGLGRLGLVGRPDRGSGTLSSPTSCVPSQRAIS